MSSLARTAVSAPRLIQPQTVPTSLAARQIAVSAGRITPRHLARTAHTPLHVRTITSRPETESRKLIRTLNQNQFTRIKLTYHHLRAGWVRNLEVNPHLRELNLSGVQFSTIDLAHLLASSENLKSFQSTPLPTRDAEHTSVEEFCHSPPFHYSNKSFERNTVCHLPPHPHLEEFSFHCSPLSVLDIACLLKAFPGLKTLDLSYSKEFKAGNLAKAIDTLMHFCPDIAPKLETLKFNGTNVNTDDLRALLHISDNLKKVYITTCPYIDSVLLEQLCKDFPNIKILN